MLEFNEEDKNQYTTTSYSYDFGSNWENEIDEIEEKSGESFCIWLLRGSENEQ